MYSFSDSSSLLCQEKFDVVALPGLAQAGGACENGPVQARRSRRPLLLSAHSSCPLQHHRHGLVVIPLHLEIGHPAVPLGSLDPAMPQEILDAHQGGIGIEELGGHGVP